MRLDKRLFFGHKIPFASEAPWECGGGGGYRSRSGWRWLSVALGMEVVIGRVGGGGGYRSRWWWRWLSVTLVTIVGNFHSWEMSSSTHMTLLFQQIFLHFSSDQHVCIAFDHSPSFGLCSRHDTEGTRASKSQQNGFRSICCKPLTLENFLDKLQRRAVAFGLNLEFVFGDTQSENKIIYQPANT